jgi:hypothetical protein
MNVLSRMWPGSDVEKAPATAEKDEAVAIARRVLNSGGSMTATEAQILSRQLLRALALSMQG